MTIFFGDALDGKLNNNAGPVQLIDAALHSGKIHAIANRIRLNQKTVLIGDTIVWGVLPKGAVPLVGLLSASVSLGSSTLDVGTALEAAKFRAAAVFTAVDTPTLFMKAGAFSAPLAAATRLQSVIAAANLPTSDNWLDLLFLYTTPHGG